VLESALVAMEPKSPDSTLPIKWSASQFVFLKALVECTSNGRLCRKHNLDIVAPEAEGPEERVGVPGERPLEDHLQALARQASARGGRIALRNEE
jgi:hypothetical protein